MTRDLALWMGLAVLVGFVAGWLAHGVYVELWRVGRWAVSTAGRLYGWHRARRDRRLAEVERRLSQMWVDLR